MNPLIAPYWSRPAKMFADKNKDELEVMEVVEIFQEGIKEMAETHLESIQLYCDYWAANYIAALGCEIKLQEAVCIDGVCLESVRLDTEAGGLFWTNAEDGKERPLKAMPLGVQLQVLELLSEWAYEYANFHVYTEYDGDKSAGIEDEGEAIKGLRGLQNYLVDLDTSDIVSITVASNNAFYVYNNLPAGYSEAKVSFGVSKVGLDENKSFYRGAVKKYRLSEGLIPTDLILKLEVDG